MVEFHPRMVGSSPGGDRPSSEKVLDHSCSYSERSILALAQQQLATCDQACDTYNVACCPYCTEVTDYSG
uniref:Uncharacterized protein n=1 Tax=Acrobeloides nanus TaxID=290746 RepID=A0A914D917_9BILA